MSLRLLLAFALLVVAASAAVAQIKPETSGARSFNEPEQSPNRKGSYLPNQPGEPKTGQSGGSIAGSGGTGTARGAAQPR